MRPTTTDHNPSFEDLLKTLALRDAQIEGLNKALEEAKQENQELSKKLLVLQEAEIVRLSAGLEVAHREIAQLHKTLVIDPMVLKKQQEEKEKRRNDIAQRYCDLASGNPSATVLNFFRDDKFGVAANFKTEESEGIYHVRVYLGQERLAYYADRRSKTAQEEAARIVLKNLCRSDGIFLNKCFVQMGLLDPESAVHSEMDEKEMVALVPNRALREGILESVPDPLSPDPIAALTDFCKNKLGFDVEFRVEEYSRPDAPGSSKVSQCHTVYFFGNQPISNSGDKAQAARYALMELNDPESGLLEKCVRRVAGLPEVQAAAEVVPTTRNTPLYANFKSEAGTVPAASHESDAAASSTSREVVEVVRKF